MATEQNVEDAIALMIEFGQIDGAHHKNWVIDQALRLLMGAERYNWFIANCIGGSNEWDVGIAP